jgi:folylpolyglutamate synthase/dihydropteroate synthase
MAQDKDLRKILRHLLKIIDIFIFPQIDLSRMDRQAGSASPGKLGEIIKEESPEKEVVITSGMKEALELALKISERRPLLVTGSFHTVGEAMIILGIKVL